MFSKRVMMIVLALMLCLTGPVRGQAEINALVFDQWSQSKTARSAFRALGYTWTWAASEGEFIATYQSKRWDLVVLELPHDDLTQKETIAQLLEDHVAAGGRLIVNFNNLDEWPRLQRLLGLDTVVSYAEGKERVERADPIHASWGLFKMEGITSPWADAGDELIPAPRSEVASLFADGTIATVVANDWRTIVNGFDFDSYGGGPTSVISKEQIKYVMRCPADFDVSTGVGELDIFDFLEFQDSFIKQSPKANLAFDKSFDIFDFLAFQNAFVSGCD